jgi:hypothetical protein
MVTESSLFVNNARKINSAFDDLIGFYSEGDYRTGYVRTFAMLLSTCIPDGIIEQNSLYVDTCGKFPLGSDDRERMSREAFFLYFKTFEQIMRDLSMIGASREDSDIAGNIDGMAINVFSEWRCNDA